MTIFNALRAKFGRDPTNAECREKIFRIRRDARPARPRPVRRKP
jgi:hypothetical protein